ncbi:SDR family NAD(P)-dependent oxidoreductase [Corallincola spongiicola]|uniref:SDR family NAD(P)-dependent oxidoreductase n=1 Tax=Corallincola spongiicola TaxID=2520508 RepID=A0ABY1WLZ6_9GAMM|nr:SDR family NAD(P)-dependent oxidoreductase [Corallincola spongiicola]TAA42623.1 SDR family NAD(P)-dependent oxidoreductase [Corallincola spongiicola]
MQKTILITGSTDGIGLATANMLLAQGHRILLHGRNADKLNKVKTELAAQAVNNGSVAGYVADLSDMAGVEALATAVAADLTTKHQTLDVLINNAGVFSVPNPMTPAGLDVRFVVNTLAPYLLTQKLLPVLAKQGRVVNLSSAAQAPVDISAMEGSALQGQGGLPDGAAYAQSKLALTMWSMAMAEDLTEQFGAQAPVIVAVNPASFLASKMVKDAYGMAGNDLSIGADILVRAAVSDEFADASGKYYDNDARCFAQPHADALDKAKRDEVVAVIQTLVK